MGHRQGSDRYGFRYRGGENTRIEAFTDAAFAFAVTLLMIGGGHVPTDVPQLLDALKGVPGYAASFALLCLFWHAHYAWYRRYGIEDGRSILLSLLLVFLVLIYIYPLHMMFNAAISLGGAPLSGAAVAIHTPGDWKVVYEVFGIAYASMAAVIVLFYLHAWSQRDTLGLDAGERATTRSGIWRWTISLAVGALSAVCALALPPRWSAWYALPGLLYWLLAVSGPLLRRRLHAQLAAVNVQ